MIFLGFEVDIVEQVQTEDRKKRPRTAFTSSQIKCLESEFEKNKYLSVAKRLQLSKSLKLTETQVMLRHKKKKLKLYKSTEGMGTERMLKC